MYTPVNYTYLIFFFFFYPKHTLWVLVRTALHTMYVLSKNIVNITIFLAQFSIFTAETNLYILHGRVFVLNFTATHPSATDGEIDVTLLQAGSEDEIIIKVKNCNDEFYVYELQPTSSCPEAYCFGENF